jgi:hypothetical protein
VLAEHVKSSNQILNNNNTEGGSQKLSPSDYYIENGKYVFTEVFHIERGYCCGNFCRHCAYQPPYQKGNTILNKKKE